jgi:hypothetical protein
VFPARCTRSFYSGVRLDEDLLEQVERLYGCPVELIARQLGLSQRDFQHIYDELRPKEDEE